MAIRRALGRCYRRNLFFRFHQAFPRRTYSQYGEDLLLDMLLGPIHSVVDVGANDGVSYSNTFLFVLRGARALLFEPIPEIFGLLQDFTASASNVIAVNEGISNRETQVEFEVQGALSFATDTEDKEHSEGCRSLLSSTPRHVRATVRPLSYWTQKLPQFRQPAFVSIDVEGHELNVLKGMDFEHCQPRALVLETHGPSPSGYWLHRDYESVAALVQSAGYFHALSTLGNSIWIRSGDPAASRISAAALSAPDVFADEPPELGDVIQRRYSIREKSGSSRLPEPPGAGAS